MPSSTTVVANAIAMLVLAVPPGHAEGCRPVEPRACILELRAEAGPTASASCTDENWTPHLAFQQPELFSDSNDDGWSETVVEIDLDPALGCACAVFRVHYSVAPTGSTVNIGDSASNDGGGGDAGTDPIHSAEVQVSSSGDATVLSVFSATNPMGGNDRGLRLNFPSLEERFVEFEICDQFFAFAVDGDHDSGVAGSMHTLASQNLFAVATSSETDESRDRDPSTMDSWIYAGFNRVIHRRRGAPAKGRTGTGVQRVEIFLTP